MDIPNCLAENQEFGVQDMKSFFFYNPYIFSTH